MFGGKLSQEVVSEKKCIDRDNSVSICRAIAIVCMVAGHSWINSPVEVGVNLFDMTLFYFVSGYCFKPKYLNNALLFLKNRIKGLWIPYLKWGVISVLLHNLFLSIGIYSLDKNGIAIPHWESSVLLKRIAGCLIFGTGPDGFLGAYWFLKDMFFAVSIAFSFLLLLKGKRNSALIGSGLFLILSILKLHFKLAIPYIHTSTLISASFFCLGFFVKQMDITTKIAKITKYSIYIFAFSLCLLCLGYILYPTSMSNLNLDEGSIEHLLSFFLYSTMASLAIIVICKILVSKYNTGFPMRIMVFIGDNTLSILTFHLLAFKLVNFVICQIFSLPTYTIGLYPTNLDFAPDGWWIIYTITGVAIPLILVGIKKKVQSAIIPEN